MARRLKVLLTIGTRPEIIKCAPVIWAMRKLPDKIDLLVVSTGQHREMLWSLTDVLGVRIDRSFEIMREDQTSGYVAAMVMRDMDDLIGKERPDLVLVQGDTTSAMAAAMAAFYRRVRVGHIEAGLRTYDPLRPFPEEVNRRLIDQVASLYFAPTRHSRENLLREGVLPEKIEQTGNTAVDTLLTVARRPIDIRGTDLENIPFDLRKMILLTTHRRESIGEPLDNICRAVKALASRREDLGFLIPVHPNPRVRRQVEGALRGINGVWLVDPLPLPLFIYAMKKSFLILTDSGGIQEEAPSLDIPVLVLRDVTERPEVVEVGAAKVVGTQTDKIVAAVEELCRNAEAYRAMAAAPNPYGDGTAASRIVARILKELGSGD